MAWHPIEINNWSHLVSLYSQMDYGRPSETPYLFRGQSDEGWHLEDTLSRILTPSADSEKAQRIERAAFDKFFTQAHFFLAPSNLAKRGSLLSWWAVMQHYGCPTRLLDWTSSPLRRHVFCMRNKLGERRRLFGRLIHATFSMPRIRRILQMSGRRSN